MVGERVTTVSAENKSRVQPQVPVSLGSFQIPTPLALWPVFPIIVSIWSLVSEIHSVYVISTFIFFFPFYSIELQLLSIMHLRSVHVFP